MPAGPNQSPSSAPIWGLGQNALVTDVITRSYQSDHIQSTSLAITPSDSAVLSKPVNQLIVKTTGDVSVVLQDNTTIVLPALTAGTFHKLPFSIVKVKATGTTATGITGFSS